MTCSLIYRYRPVLEGPRGCQLRMAWQGSYFIVQLAGEPVLAEEISVVWRAAKKSPEFCGVAEEDLRVGL